VLSTTLRTGGALGRGHDGACGRQAYSQGKSGGGKRDTGLLPDTTGCGEVGYLAQRALTAAHLTRGVAWPDLHCGAGWP